MDRENRTNPRAPTGQNCLHAAVEVEGGGLNIARLESAARRMALTEAKKLKGVVTTASPDRFRRRQAPAKERRFQTSSQRVGTPSWLAAPFQRPLRLTEDELLGFQHMSNRIQ